MTKGIKVYLGGPMRGIPGFNFPAFRRYAAELRAKGFEVVSPHELDESHGFDAATDAAKVDADFLREAILRDVNAVAHCDGIALMPGWQASRGVRVELAVATFLGKAVLDARTGGPYADLCTDEATRIVYGDRATAYGHPLDECERIGRLWSAILGFDVPAERVPLCMIALKISRELNAHGDDNLVDVAGYALCLQRIEHEKRRRATDPTAPLLTPVR